MIVLVPADVPPVQQEVWRLAGRLFARHPSGWTIVGGQMMQFHGWRTGVPPMRAAVTSGLALAPRRLRSGRRPVRGVR